MHVGVKVAVADGMPEKGLDDVARQRDPVVAGGFDGGEVAQADAVDPLRREHVPRGEVPFGPRHAEARIVLRVLGEFRDRRRFEAKIHLDGDGAGERLDDLLRPQAPHLRRAALERGARRPAWPAGRGRNARARRGARPSRPPLPRPPGSRMRALCTWAMEAAATGSLNSTKEVADRTPERRLDDADRVALGKGGMRSCSRSRSRAAATPTMSGRVARNWPNFT